jgi:hypothetical protein
VVRLSPVPGAGTQLDFPAVRDQERSRSSCVPTHPILGARLTECCAAAVAIHWAVGGGCIRLPRRHEAAVARKPLFAGGDAAGPASGFEQRARRFFHGTRGCQQHLSACQARQQESKKLRDGAPNRVPISLNNAPFVVWHHLAAVVRRLSDRGIGAGRLRTRRARQPRCREHDSTDALRGKCAVPTRPRKPGRGWQRRTPITEKFANDRQRRSITSSG